MPLTELTIKSLKPKEKLYRKADGNGLCLEISPAGGKLWRYRYIYNGKGQMLALGRYPDVTFIASCSCVLVIVLLKKPMRSTPKSGCPVRIDTVRFAHGPVPVITKAAAQT
jgi:hypothetical protein